MSRLPDYMLDPPDEPLDDPPEDFDPDDAFVEPDDDPGPIVDRDCDYWRGLFK